MEPSDDRHPPIGWQPNLYLVIPWVVTVAFIVSIQSGVLKHGIALVPNGWGSLGLMQANLGLAMCFLGCSFYWAYCDEKRHGSSGFQLIARMMISGLLALCVHFYVLVLLTLARRLLIGLVTALW